MLMLPVKKKKSINQNIKFGQIKIQFKDVIIIVILIIVVAMIILEVVN